MSFEFVTDLWNRPLCWPKIKNLFQHMIQMSRDGVSSLRNKSFFAFILFKIDDNTCYVKRSQVSQWLITCFSNTVKMQNVLSFKQKFWQLIRLWIDTYLLSVFLGFLFNITLSLHVCTSHYSLRLPLWNVFLKIKRLGNSVRRHSINMQ